MAYSLSRCLGTAFINVCLVVLIWLPSYLLKHYGEPIDRGFFCDDESIMYPYKDNTIQFYTVCAIGFGVPLISILLIETLLLQKQQKLCSRSEKNGNLPQLIINLYCYWGLFLTGAALTTMFTDISKYLVGRPRPHFLSVCLPRNITQCMNMNNRYFTQDSCTGTDVAKLKDMTMSFPSGHTSIAIYTALAFCVYLQCRKHITNFIPMLIILRPFVMGIIVMMAIGTGLSRISDYKHHWSDVLAGLLVGAFFALLGPFFIYNIYVEYKVEMRHQKNAEDEESLLNDITNPGETSMLIDK